MPAQPSVLVCVANPSSCRHVVEVGMAVAEKEQLPIKVVSILPPGPIGPEESQTVQQLHNIIRRCGAELTVFFNDAPALMAAVYARQCNAAYLVCGIPGGENSPKATPFVETLHELLPTVLFTLVDEDNRVVELPAAQMAVVES